MKKKKKKIIITFILMIVLLYGLTGEEIQITYSEDIDHLIENLNQIKFKKDSFVMSEKGYVFRTTIYNNKGKAIKELIINSKDEIRYKGFLYTTENKVIDFDYIVNLFN